MIQKIINHKKFGPIPVGNPTLENFPKHSSLLDTFNDLRVINMDITEVRSQTSFHVNLTRDKVVVTSLELELPREFKKFESKLNATFRSEKNPKPRFRLDSYEYDRG